LTATLAADFPDDPRYRSVLAESYASLGGLLGQLGHGAAAVEEYRKALLIQEKLAAEFPDVLRYWSGLAGSHNNLGFQLQALNQGAAAEGQYRKALAIQEKLAADFPAVPEYRSAVALSHTNLGIMFVNLVQDAMAEEQYRKALAIHEKLAADFPAVTQYQLDLGGSYCNLGKLTRYGGDLVESMKWLDRAVDCLKTVYDKEPRDVTAKYYLRSSYEGRAITFEELQKFAEAVKDWDQAIALSPPAEQPGYRGWALISRVGAGMLSEAVAEVAELTKSSNWNAGQWYNLACACSVASGQIADKKAEYTDRAMEFLTTAVEAGWNDAAQMKADTDLDPLRAREDFKKLLAELEAKFPPMQEVIPPPKEGKQ
jgi:eukaryotic-like serine/threonine-protein kinase